MPHGEPNPEFELKLTAPPSVLREAFARAGAAGETTGQPATDRLTAVYYDTLDRRLARHGAALRVRRGGGGFTQTL
jgi:inorganic triphosphatase YgiF